MLILISLPKAVKSQQQVSQHAMSPTTLYPFIVMVQWTSQSLWGSARDCAKALLDATRLQQMARPGPTAGTVKAKDMAFNVQLALHLSKMPILFTIREAVLGRTS